MSDLSHMLSAICEKNRRFVLAPVFNPNISQHSKALLRKFQKSFKPTTDNTDAHWFLFINLAWRNKQNATFYSRSSSKQKLNLIHPQIFQKKATILVLRLLVWIKRYVGIFILLSFSGKIFLSRQCRLLRDWPGKMLKRGDSGAVEKVVGMRDEAENNGKSGPRRKGDTQPFSYSWFEIACVWWWKKEHVGLLKKSWECGVRWVARSKSGPRKKGYRYPFSVIMPWGCLS